MKSSNRVLRNRIATAANSLKSRPQSLATAGFIMIGLPLPRQALGGFDFYRFLYDRAVAQMEAVRRRRWEIRAARVISLN